MNITVYDLWIYFNDGEVLSFKNISRVACERYIEWYEEKKGFGGFDMEESAVA